MQVWNGAIYGVWLVGNAFFRSADYYGAYSHSVLDRLLTLFPETPRLHLFSGMVCDPDAVRFDINAECEPDVVGDVVDLASYFPPRHFGVVLADPPYDAKACSAYGTRPFCKRLALKQVARVLRPGGMLAWLDVRTPIWSKREWQWAGLIGLHQGTNRRILGLSMLRRKR
ncbi:MAG: hypothetical protein KAX44_08550 [Candidatus Brocadiae bacterium]|nr:hypothetical protein [Candidatus Brocadiia bacterium]